MKVDSLGLKIYLLDVLADLPGHLRQQCAEGTYALRTRNLAGLSTEQQAKVRSQAAVDRVLERQPQRRG
jgi:hypothetical protein